ncbi:MAG: hypothetical protein AAF940_15175 [Pseudomonadota bacterium]
MEPMVLNQICAALEAGQRGVLVLELGEGRSRFVGQDHALVGEMKNAIDEVLTSGLSAVRTIGTHAYLLKPIG